MDKRAAAQYLDKVFGNGEGYVSAAYKGKDQWDEQQFAWPAGKDELLVWSAEREKSGDVFICPALRQSAHTRKKGDMQPSYWLWADVDWQSVPADKVGEVKARITEVATMQVLSGSDLNVHVYVKLTAPVAGDQFNKLNTGLRDYLYADNKQADNSLLRLPGTTNWKATGGTPVKVLTGAVGKAVMSTTLMKHRVFRDAKVSIEAEASEWEFVEIEGLSRRMKSLVTMPVPEALDRYKSRYKAVWAVTGDLHKRGMGSDEIHSLMDKFPAALSKSATDNGYDVHRDVDKRLAWDRSRQIEAPTDETSDGAGEVFEDVPLEEVQAALLAEGVERELLRRDIRKAADRAEGERGWVPPSPGASWSLHNAKNDPPAPIGYLIEGLAGARHNVLLTAQYKFGKTAFMTGSIAAALCDGEDFLDHFKVNVPPGGVVVGHWNCEMDPTELLDDYILPVGIQNDLNLNVLNLRGEPVNVLTTMGREYAISWLKGEIPDKHGDHPLPTKVWTIDSFARLARMANVSEKDNDEVMSLLMTLDEIKVAAGVEVLFLIAHTGRAEMEEGKERARGATALDDWCDARWIMTKDKDLRFFRVDGRGVFREDSALIFDPDTKRSTLGFGGKTEAREGTVKDMVVKAVMDSPGLTRAELLRALKTIGISQRAATEPIEEAVVGGFIEIRMEQRGGGRAAKCHYPMGSMKGESSRHQATARDVDLRGVRPSTRKRPRPNPAMGA